jgi:hypothetical protein
MKLPCRQPPHLGLGCIVKTDNAQTCEFCLSLGRWGLDPPAPPAPKKTQAPSSLSLFWFVSLQWILSVCVRGEKEKEKKAFEIFVCSNVKTFLLGMLKLSTFCFNVKKLVGRCST